MQKLRKRRIINDKKICIILCLIMSLVMVPTSAFATSKNAHIYDEEIMHDVVSKCSNFIDETVRNDNTTTWNKNTIISDMTITRDPLKKLMAI